MNFRDPTTVVKVRESRQELLRKVPRISNSKVRRVLKDVLEEDSLVLDKISKTRLNNTRRSSPRARRSSTKRNKNNNKNNSRNNNKNNSHNKNNSRNNNKNNRRNNTNDACNISDDDFEKLSSEEQNNLVEKC